jgi:FixJ family two-component response regulator
VDSVEGGVALLVDDSRLDQLRTRSMLLGSTAGFTRLEWLDHWPGLDEALRRGPFGLYIVDINLGADSGLEVIRDLRAGGVREPIIALTGRDDEDVDRACTDAGASDFLVKDRVDAATLARSIRYAQKQAETHRELDRLNAALERRALAEGEQARLMRFAIEQSLDAIFLTKIDEGAGRPGDEAAKDHAIVYVNAALCQLLGRRAGDLLGTDAADLFGAGTAKGGGELDRSLRAHAMYAGGIWLKRKGHPIRATMRATPLRASGDAVSHYAWNCRADEDAALDAKATRARERFETIGRITAGFAHDLNDRLTAVIGNLELLSGRHDARDEKPIAGALRAAEDLAEQARVMIALTNRDDASADREVDIDGCLDTIMPLLQHAVGRLVTIARRPVTESPWHIEVDDPVHLEIVLVALAIRVRTTMTQGGVLEIAVRNVGIDALGAEPIASTLLDRRDYVALSMSDAEPSALDVEPIASRDERRSVEELARRVGGTLALGRSARGRAMATLYLPRVS